MNIDLFKPANTLQAVLLIVSVQITISSVESLYNYDVYKPGRLLNWDFIRQTRKIFTVNTMLAKIIDFLFRYPNNLFLHFLRLGTTVVMVYLIVSGKPFGIAVVLVTITIILTGLRDSYSNNGSDQLTSIILIAICFTVIRPSSVVIQYTVIGFIAFQASLSYLTSGMYKLINEGWRDGNNLRQILSTGIFGNRQVKQAMDSLPNSYILASFIIIFGELFLGIAFIFPPPLCLLLLCTGVLFHLSVALVMGLNTFIWTFGSTYPAIYFLSLHLFHHAAGAINS